MSKTRMTSSHTKNNPSGLNPTFLLCGLILAPLFFVLVFVQAFTRAGFDLGRAPLSLLSLGDLGWVQIANFILTGLLALACAAGVRGAWGGGRGGVWGPILIAASGFGLILAGVFHPDPGYSFPPGSNAPVAMGPSMSGHAAVHNAGFMIVVVSLVVAAFVLARGFSARGDSGWGVYSLATGILAPLLLATGIATNTVPLITLMAMVLFGWLSAVAAHLRVGLMRASQIEHPQSSRSAR